jgi:hypothetical protein
MSAAAPRVTAASVRTAWRIWAQRTAPYVVAASVVAWLLHKYPLREIVAEMRLGHAMAMVPAGVVLAFVVWLPYAASDRVIMLGAIGPIPYRDVVRAKAATATLLLLGYFFGGGGYAVWIARKTGIGAARAAGVVLYAMSSDLAALCLVGGISAWLGGAEVPHVLRAVATTVFAVLVTLILVAPFGVPRRLPAVFQPWRTVPRAWGLAQIGVRTVNIAIISGLTWVGARAFGMQVPASVMALYMPVILLATSLPISVAGLGAAQAAWLLLLPWASGPRILAFQVLWQLCTSAGVLLRGLPFVRRVAGEMAGGAQGV